MNMVLTQIQSPYSYLPVAYEDDDCVLASHRHSKLFALFPEDENVVFCFYFEFYKSNNTTIIHWLCQS